MRILYLTEAFPYPLTSGYLRHYFFLRELARRHSVTLLSLVDAEFQKEHQDALVPFTESILTFREADPDSGPRTIIGKTVRKFGAMLVPNASVRAMTEAVGRLIQAGRFDALVYSGTQTFPVLAQAGRLPIIADLCDAGSVRLRATARHSNLRRRTSLWLDYLRRRHIEQRLINGVRRVLFASARDRQALLGDDTMRASVVPNGVDEEFWKRSTPTLGRNTIIFTGRMGYQPNWDAALYLVEELLPGVRQAIPDVQVLLVGREPPEALLRAGQQPGVTVTGYVDDMRPYLEHATVFAAPLRFGAGIQNKVLEAMAMAVPVVASPLAAAGLRTEDGFAPPIQVAEGREQFIAQLIEQLQRCDADPTPDTAVREYVQRHFSWIHSGGKLEEILQQIAPSTAQPLPTTCS